jgi:hypothetical protein
MDLPHLTVSPAMMANGNRITLSRKALLSIKITSLALAHDIAATPTFGNIGIREAPGPRGNLAG